MVMKLSVKTEDPLEILSSTKPVVEDAKYVFIHQDKLGSLAEKIKERFRQGLDTQELGFGSAGDLDDDMQLIFVEDVINFCFWPSKGQPKWEVEWPEGGVAIGGWYGLVACLKRALAEGVPILDADYLSNITDEQARIFFRAKDSIEIPLLTERINCLQEAGRILREKFDGKFANLVLASNYDAIEVVKSVLDNFPYFRDISVLDGREVRLLKRAQICANDLSYVFKGKNKQVANLDELCAYADYKLPQVLRMFGIFEYENSLADKIDSMVEVPHDSREEIEIRAATIWAVELLRQFIGKLSAGEIDNTIWLISQGIQNESKPYHRTRTIFY